MTTGEHVPAPQALEWKVVDEIVPSGTDMVDHAKALCKTKMGLPTPKIVEMPPPAPDTDFDEWQVNMAKARPGEIAPGAIIRCVQGAVAGPTFRDGDKVEDGGDKDDDGDGSDDDIVANKAGTDISNTGEYISQLIMRSFQTCK